MFLFCSILSCLLHNYFTVEKHGCFTLTLLGEYGVDLIQIARVEPNFYP